MNNIQKFLFASINMETGRLMTPRSYIAYGACAIAVYELIRQGRLKCEGKTAASVSSASVGEPFLDEVLSLIQKRGSAYKLRTLISSAPYRIKGMVRRLFEDIEDNGLVRIEQRRFLGLIPYNRYIVTKAGICEKLINELKDIVMTDKRNTEADMAFLSTLLLECRVLRRLFSADERKRLKAGFRQIGRFNFFETLDDSAITVLKAVRDAITAAETAAT